MRIKISSPRQRRRGRTEHPRSIADAPDIVRWFQIYVEGYSLSIFFFLFIFFLSAFIPSRIRNHEGKNNLFAINARNLEVIIQVPEINVVIVIRFLYGQTSSWLYVHTYNRVIRDRRCALLYSMIHKDNIFLKFAAQLNVDEIIFKYFDKRKKKNKIIYAIIFFFCLRFCSHITFSFLE